MIPVTLRQVSKKFGRTVAVNAVDLAIEPGELFFLLGPSGCGKTTLLRMIAGLHETTGGTIHFGDRDVTSLPTGQRQCAMVFQSYALWPHMTVAQNVAFGLDVKKVPSAEKQQKVAEALQRVQLTEQADRRPAQLSGGQQQRVALARALVVNPQVLLLDEPLSNLDAKLRLEMRAEIRRICKSAEITTVYVTHDQHEALSMADRIAVMQDGNLMQVGPPRGVYDRPSSKFVADFLGTTNFVPAMISSRDSGSIELETAAGTIRSSVVDGVPTAGDVTCSIRPEALRVLDNGEAADNTFTAMHRSTVYLGNVAQHTFAINDDLSVEVDELSPRPRDWSKPVQLGFDADDVVVLGA